jgi:hypothetical protein
MLLCMLISLVKFVSLVCIYGIWCDLSVLSCFREENLLVAASTQGKLTQLFLA